MFELIDFLIVNPIVNILFVVYNFIGDFGIAIIIFTIIVKFLTWPLMKKQLYQTRLMREIQPELTEIRKRCNGNKQMESLQMMELYKRRGVKPMSSFWTILIQLPIFIGMFTAIRVMALPTSNDYLEKRAYAPVASLDRIHDVIEKQKDYFEKVENHQEGEDNPTYEFKPMLFNQVDLSVRPGTSSTSQFIVLAFAVGAALVQYFNSKQQLAKNKKKGEKTSTWKKMIADAKEGKDPDQNDINNMVSGQMTFMMPLMMLMITINLPGALCFYYFLSNVISTAQQRYILNKANNKMDDDTDREILKELKQKTKQIQEAEVVENKKTGTKITRIKAKDVKNKNKKSSKKSQSGKG